MNNFKQDLQDYILSGHALLYVSTFEKERAAEEIEKHCKEIKKETLVWSVSSGWTTVDGSKIEGIGACLPDMVIGTILNMPENVVCIVKEFWPYVNKDCYNEFDRVISQISESKNHISHNGKTIIFLGAEFEIPISLRHDITTLDFSLPDKAQIKNNILFVGESVETKDGKPFQINPEIMDDTIRACQGMTSCEIIDRVSLAVRKHKTIDHEAIKTILREKAAVIRASGLLTYIEPPSGGLSNIGGYDVLKRTIMLDKPCFSDKARDFGIEPPKGILQVGVPGCGKTKVSICVASELNLPLIALDIGSLMGSLVGSSEQNTRQALKIIESVSPCVLQMDEVDKAFGDSLDGGASLRVFGTILKWLSDRVSIVYAIATANNVQRLPAEFLRPGRFDSVFFLDLPCAPERKAITNIHLAQRGRDPNKFKLDKIVDMTKDYSGSEIEQVVKTGLKIAFHMSEELDQSHLEMAIPSVIPLSKIEPEKIHAMREWGKSHAKLANGTSEEVVEKKSRKVSV